MDTARLKGNPLPLCQSGRGPAASVRQGARVSGKTGRGRCVMAVGFAGDSRWESP